MYYVLSGGGSNIQERKLEDFSCQSDTLIYLSKYSYLCEDRLQSRNQTDRCYKSTNAHKRFSSSYAMQRLAQHDGICLRCKTYILQSSTHSGPFWAATTTRETTTTRDVYELVPTPNIAAHRTYTISTVSKNTDYN
jgi:hypothetical protein